MSELINSENCSVIRQIISEGFTIRFHFTDEGLVMESDPSKKYPFRCMSAGPCPCPETGAIIYRVYADDNKGYAVNHPIDDQSMY